MHARVTIDCDVAPQFTAVYLRVAGEQCAFIETHTSLALPRLLSALQVAGRQPEDVRWVVVTHAHLDHAAGASALMKACPNATLIAHPRAAKHLIDPTKLVASATSVYGEARFAQLYGSIDPIPAERVKALEDGHTFELGDATLQVFHTAGHANHHFVVHDPALASVYTGDSFGLVYPALQKKGRFALASTSPTNFDAVQARKSVKRIIDIRAKNACLTHFDAYSDVREIGAQVSEWINRAEAWVDEASKGEETAEVMTARLAQAWRDAIIEDANTRGLQFGDAELKVLALDIELNAQGLAYVAIARRGHSPH